MRVIIAGGRDFDDYDIAKKKLDFLLKDVKDITIVSGGAKGADSIGEQYAINNKLSLIQCKANWNKFGKSAGYIRNKEMAEISHALIAIWDGKSKGTKHMIDIAKKYNLKIKIIKY